MRTLRHRICRKLRPTLRFYYRRNLVSNEHGNHKPRTDNSDPIHINVTHMTDEANNGNCEGCIKYRNIRRYGQITTTAFPST